MWDRRKNKEPRGKHLRFMQLHTDGASHWIKIMRIEKEMWRMIQSLVWGWHNGTYL
jgi:hypothetical protein